MGNETWGTTLLLYNSVMAVIAVLLSKSICTWIGCKRRAYVILNLLFAGLLVWFYFIPVTSFPLMLANQLLIALVAGLTEAFHLAETFGLDPAQFAEVVAAGPMASPVATGKAAKLVAGDFAAEAAVHDVHKNTELIVAAARRHRTPAPMLQVCRSLFEQAERAGLGDQDMAAVLHAVRTQPPA